MLCAAHDCAVGEALCVAKKHGLDMKLVFDAMRVSSGNSFCWETEVPLVLTGSYDPNFTARMMHKDISLGLELARRHGVPQPMNELVLARYERAIEAYGEHQGSTIPVKLIEDASGAPRARRGQREGGPRELELHDRDHGRPVPGHPQRRREPVPLTVDSARRAGSCGPFRPPSFRVLSRSVRPDVRPCLKTVPARSGVWRGAAFGFSS